MNTFICSVWPLLLAGLIGWLLCGMMARSFLRGKDLSGATPRPPVERVVEKLVPDTAGLAEKDQEIARLRALLAQVEQMRQEQLAQRDAQLHALLQAGAAADDADAAIDVDAARLAGVVVKGADDLELIEGIGPKIAGLLRAAGIHTFAQLARTPTARIQEVLDAAGPTFRIANPGTWAEQAGLCARNQWAEFKALTDELVAGVRVGNGSDAGKAQ
jgi:predicted flap endonuclease-1-like 5' DNA nuclease